MGETVTKTRPNRMVRPKACNEREIEEVTGCRGDVRSLPAGKRRTPEKHKPSRRRSPPAFSLSNTNTEPLAAYESPYSLSDELTAKERWKWKNSEMNGGGGVAVVGLWPELLHRRSSSPNTLRLPAALSGTPPYSPDEHSTENEMKGGGDALSSAFALLPDTLPSPELIAVTRLLPSSTV